MSKDVLQNQTLLLNKFWQVVCVKTTKEILPMIVTDVATPLQIDADDIRPVKWDEWITLPIRTQDDVIHTCRLSIRVPTVIVCTSYAQVPKRRPNLNLRTLRERERGRCAYTGKLLKPEDSSVDHVLPVSRGGKTSWKNCVLADRKINSLKSNRLPGEAGLKLLVTPFEPPLVPVSATIRNTHGIADWNLFLQ